MDTLLDDDDEPLPSDPEHRLGALGFVTTRPVAITMFMLAMAVFGWVSFTKLRVDLLPEISYPTLTVRTTWPGAAPEDMEQRVSERVQEALSTLPGLVRSTSTSRAGVSDVVLDFDWDTQMTFAVQDVREKLDSVFLPTGAERPLILRYDPNLDPILRVGVRGAKQGGSERDLMQLRWIAENVLKRELEAMEGVAAVQVHGGLEEEIHVRLDPYKLAARNLDPAAVAARLAQENINASGGSVREGSTEYLVRTLNEFRDVEEIADLALALRGDAVVRVRDVATVLRTHARREVITRLGGAEAVEIAVYREAGANIVRLAERVKERLFGTEVQRKKAEEIAEQERASARGPSLAERQQADYLEFRLRRDARLEVLSDQSTFIRSAVADVRDAALMGSGLAVFVILLFLRRIAATLIIGVAIPISVVVTFALMYMLGVTLNIMSLGGLALGVGMLVDNAIVVLESITRCREEGDSLAEAAVRGTREVFGAVTSSTLTTVAVFAPIVFVTGIAGQLFADQALTVVTALSVSLVVALFFIPMLASRRWLAGRSAEGTRAPGPLERAYLFVLRPALAHPLPVVLAAAALTWVALERVGALGVELLPEIHQGEFTAHVELGIGSPLAFTDQVLSELDRDVRALPSVETTALAVGVERETLTRDVEGPHTARLSVRLDSSVSDPESEERVTEVVRRVLAAHPAVRSIDVRRPTPFALDAPIAVEVKGHDLERIEAIAAEVVERLARIENLTELRSSVRPGHPEARITFDRDKTLEFGLDLAAVSALVRDQVLGNVGTRFSEGEDRIDVRVLGDEIVLSTLEAVLDLVVNPQSPTPVPLRSVADVAVVQGPAEIRRIGNTRGVSITAESTGLDLGGVAERIDAAIADLEVPDDVFVGLGGQKREMDEALASMRFALLLAVFLVYVVMASQFESLVQPLIILITVPLAAIGVVFTLDFAGLPLSVVVFIGLIILAGIVVNNAIVLIDRINQKRAQGLGLEEAVIEAGRVRLRPILMTTGTTVLGLLPLTGWLAAVPLIGQLGSGDGAEMRAPMAITVIAGLTSSTLLTLVVIPTIYALLERAGEARRRPT